MKYMPVLRAWASILSGRAPCLSIEITRECPLTCPGCYAYEDAHLGGMVTLRQLADHKGDALVEGVLKVLDEKKPLHLSIVGGEPLVRCRELDVLLPQISRKGIQVMLVTSAVRPIPVSWASLPGFNISVSIDGLQPEHDARRKPATYERILKNIAGHHVTVHCTITGQMADRPGYMAEFLGFWSGREEAKRIWISTFTPQRGVQSPECLSVGQRDRVIQELIALGRRFPKLDMTENTIREFAHPPKSPEECIFAQTTHSLSADLKTRITPCQFGGDPDCSRCGCMASMGLAVVGHQPVIAGITAGQIFHVSAAFGNMVSQFRARRQNRGENAAPSVTPRRAQFDAIDSAD